MAKNIIKAKLFKTCQFCRGTGKEFVRNPDGTPTEAQRDCIQCEGTGGNQTGWVEIPADLFPEA